MDLALFFLAVAAPGAQDMPKAETILEKLEARAGDPAARGSPRGLVRKGSVQVPGMEVKGSFEIVSLGPDRAVLNVGFPGMGSSSQGTDGTHAWSTDPAMGVTVKEGEEGGSARRLFAIGRRAPWNSLYARAETVGRKEVEGRPHFELRMVPEAGDPETWFVDCETYDLTRVDLALPNPTGGKIPMEYVYGDWKVVDGVRYANRWVQRVGGMELVYVCESIAHEASLDPSSVAPPPEVAAAIADASKRTPEAKPGVFTVETVEARPAATIRAVIDAREVSKNLAILFPEVMAAIEGQGVAPAGPPFSRYHRIDEARNEMEIEAGIPVAKAIEAKGRVKPSELPGTKAATTWHLGPYQDLPKTYDALRKWMEEKKLAPAGGLWELYWTDPGLEPDPRNWKTQVFWPVREGAR
jgi:effector-binding domain-containing protein